MFVSVFSAKKALFMPTQTNIILNFVKKFLKVGELNVLVLSVERFTTNKSVGLVT